MTDMAGAAGSAFALSRAAPFPTRRSVLNILSNGVDNDGPSPDALRDHAIRLGMTINGIVFGPRADLTGYFRDHLIGGRSEEHTSELQSLMRISYALFCLINIQQLT